MGDYKRQLNRQRHEFLLTFFPQKVAQYEVKEINGYKLIKQWNGTTQRWEVAIHPPIESPYPKVSNKGQTTIF